jgi:hypothetical protein
MFSLSSKAVFTTGQVEIRYRDGNRAFVPYVCPDTEPDTGPESELARLGTLVSQQ